jgi:hypothetical protein
MEKKDVIMPRMTIMAPTVVNVSNPADNVSADGVDEGFNLSLAEDVQNEIVSDLTLKAGLLRGKLEGRGKMDDILLPDIDLDYSREDGK